VETLKRVAAGALFALGAVTMVGAQSVPAGAGAPKTPWGHPDLQGVWDFWTFTPLERPKEFEGRATLNEAEAQAFAQRMQKRALAVDNEGPGQGQVGAYGQELWTDRARATVLRQTSIIVDPEDGKLPGLTPEARKAMEAHKAAGGRPVRMRTDGIGDDNPEDRGLSERCLVGFNVGPPFLPGGYNNNVQIVQTKDYVMLHLEMNHDVRIVPLDSRPHLPSAIHTWFGDSRGRWEGNTLIVESRNFTPKVAAFSARLGAGGAEFGTGDTVTLIERFTRLDINTLQYEFTVNDPKTFTRPFTGRLPMRLSDQLMYEVACHEGNYGLANILKAGRAEERQGGSKP
jgi:hypothetical protein